VRLNVAVLRISWVQCTFFLKSWELRSTSESRNFANLFVWHVFGIKLSLYVSVTVQV